MNYLLRRAVPTALGGIATIGATLGSAWTA
jgi:hypothetical protein